MPHFIFDSKFAKLKRLQETNDDEGVNVTIFFSFQAKLPPHLNQRDQ